MKRSSLPILAAAVLLALGPAAAQPPPTADARSCFGDVLRLRLPADWTVRDEPDGSVTVTRPGGTAVAVTAWPIPRGGDASARAAAAAFESALFDQLPYLRRTAVPVKSADQRDGLLVSGQVLHAGGQIGTTTFLAFASGGQYVILGVTSPDAATPSPESALRELVAAAEFPAAAPVVEPTQIAIAPPPAAPAGTGKPTTTSPGTSVSPAGPPVLPGQTEPPKPAPGLETTPAVVTLPTPPTTPEPAKPEPPAEPPKPAPTVPVPAVTPEPDAPARPVYTKVTSPLGFTLEHPVGWQLQQVGGHLELQSPENAPGQGPTATVILWPVTQLAPGQDPAALARTLLARLPQIGARAAELRARPAENAALLAGTVGSDAAPRQLVACSHVQRDQGLVTALLARPADFAAALPDLLHILDSFSGGPWWAEAEGASKTTLWQDTGEGKLRLPVPEGWRVEGQSRRVGESFGMQLELTSPDKRLRCLWRQPVQPLYRDLTPVLRNLGWQEGDRYPANVKDNQLRILARLSPPDFLTRHWLPDEPHRLTNPVVDQLTVTPAAAGLVGRENAAAIVALLHGESATGERQRLCVVATGDIAPGGEPNCWQAALIEAEGPAGGAAEALAALRTALAGAAPADSGATAWAPVLQAARAAVAALPSSPPDATSVVDVLSIRNDQARGRLWLMSPAALAPWQQALRALARGDSVGAAVPELGADYWK